MWLRICTTCIEKPHCGACGVPFMNSTTSALSISLLMRALVSLISLVLSFGGQGSDGLSGEAFLAADRCIGRAPPSPQGEDRGEALSSLTLSSCEERKALKACASSARAHAIPRPACRRRRH